MWHNRAGEVKWQCRYPIYLSRAGAGESTFPLQQWRREEWPHKKGFVSLAAGELSGGYFQEQLEDDYSIPRVCAKPEHKETFIFPRGCHSLFRVCVMGFSQGCVTLSATHRKWISHLKLLAISQLNHRHIPFTEKLWKPQLRLSHEPDNGRIEELAFSKEGKSLNLCKSGPGECNFKGKAQSRHERGFTGKRCSFLGAPAAAACPLKLCSHTPSHSSKAEKYITGVLPVGSEAQRATGANAAIVKH